MAACQRAARAIVLSLGLLWAAMTGGGANAVEPGEMLADPVAEKRARAISQELRCVVCQNQSIDESNAELARDLRVLVRERIRAGDSDQEVIAYVVSRYGDFVLLRPPVMGSTYVLWFGPALIMLAGLAGVIIYFRRLKRTLEAPARRDQP